MAFRNSLLILALLVTTSAQATVLSFKEWKSLKLEEAYRNKQANIQIVEDLTPADYFVLYINQVYKNVPSAIPEVALKLSREELADVLREYQRLLNQDLSTQSQPNR